MAAHSDRHTRRDVDRAVHDLSGLAGRTLPGGQPPGQLSTSPESIAAPTTTLTPTWVEPTQRIRRSSPIAPHVSTASDPC